MLFFTLLLCPSVSVYADMGPKPSLDIEFRGIEEKLFYVTLTTGAAEDAIEARKQSENEPENAAWNAFVEYSGTDGFYFTGDYKEGSSSDDSKFYFNIYRNIPEEFKILIYYPESDRLVVSSEVCQRHNFYSRYIIQMDGQDIQSVKSDQNAFMEILKFFARMVATIVIELLIVLPFVFRNQQKILVIVITNVVTQLLLNIVMTFCYAIVGGWALIFFYPALELGVVLIEGTVYSILLHRFDTKKRKIGISILLAWLYAIIANVLSFLVGYVMYALS